jgi:hypothetical protein
MKIPKSSPLKLHLRVFAKKMIPIRTSLLAVALLVPSSVVADTLRAGTKIDTAAADMRLKGYKETGLQMAPVKTTEELKFWQINDGVLIVTYSKQTQQIKKIAYLISDDGSKSERHEVNLTVIEFNPDSGIMTIQTKK